MNSHAENQVPSPQDEAAYATWSQIARGMMGASVDGVIVETVGTGAPLDVDGLTFDPAMVLVINETTDIMSIHVSGMTADTARAFATGLAIANGVTLGAAEEGKVTLGAGLHAASDVLRVVCFGVPVQQV